MEGGPVQHHLHHQIHHHQEDQRRGGGHDDDHGPHQIREDPGGALDVCPAGDAVEPAPRDVQLLVGEDHVEIIVRQSIQIPQGVDVHENHVGGAVLADPCHLKTVQPVVVAIRHGEFVSGLQPVLSGEGGTQHHFLSAVRKVFDIKEGVVPGDPQQGHVEFVFSETLGEVFCHRRIAPVGNSLGGVFIGIHVFVVGVRHHPVVDLVAVHVAVNGDHGH